MTIDVDEPLDGPIYRAIRRKIEEAMCQHQPGKEVCLARGDARKKTTVEIENVTAYVCKLCGVLYVPEGDREDPTTGTQSRWQTP